MSGSDHSISRRGLFAGAVATGVAGAMGVPAQAGVDPVHRCARLLADAMAAKHGGVWRVHVDHHAKVAMAWAENSREL